MDAVSNVPCTISIYIIRGWCNRCFSHIFYLSPHTRSRAHTCARTHTQSVLSYRCMHCWRNSGLSRAVSGILTQSRPLRKEWVQLGRQFLQSMLFIGGPVLLFMALLCHSFDLLPLICTVDWTSVEGVDMGSLCLFCWIAWMVCGRSSINPSVFVFGNERRLENVT
jgi:hypothetical protein